MTRGFNTRALSYGLASFGLAVLSPRLPRGLVPFLTSPCGLGVAALALTAIGVSVEETGTLRRIRLGLGINLAAAALLVVAAAWCLALGAPGGGAGALGLGLLACGLGGALWLAARDARARRDVRAGQRVYVDRFGPRALELVAGGAPLHVPWAALRGATPVASALARGAAIAVASRRQIEGDAAALAWLAAERDADVFVLTEYQLGLDAEAFCQRLREIAEAGPGGYR